MISIAGPALALPFFALFSSVPERPAAATSWDARAAEHLLNRAGFGGTQADVERLVALGQERAVRTFFAPAPELPPLRVIGATTLPNGLEDPAERLLSVVERREGFRSQQPDLIVPLNKFGDWWLARMVKSEEALRDHATIFWHGLMVSSIQDVANAQEMVEQIRFLRDNALGPFDVLLRGIGKTPAMLEYLDNDENVRTHPNENWARELIELFSLGDGNYTETDIKESARAFTGWTDVDGRFTFRREDHDYGQKAYLGVTGNLDGDQCIDAILATDACGRFVARRLIHYFEGLQPSPQRVADYAAFLRANRYDVGKTLERLFLDPEFYRDEVVGTRVQGPVEYVVGTCRRLELDAPGQMLLSASEMLGQRLFWPPSVKGWEGDMTWITTATLMHRSNVAGALVGVVEMKRLIVDEEFEPTAAMAGERQSRTNGLNQIRAIQAFGWKPSIDLASRARAAGATSDDALAAFVCGELLAVPVTPTIVAGPSAWLAREREAAGIAPGTLLDSDGGETLLRRLAHLILSLPEAQLH